MPFCLSWIFFPRFFFVAYTLYVTYSKRPKTSYGGCLTLVQWPVIPQILLLWRVVFAAYSNSRISLRWIDRPIIFVNFRFTSYYWKDVGSTRKCFTFCKAIVGIYDDDDDDDDAAADDDDDDDDDDDE